MSYHLVFLAEHRVMSALTKVQVARQHILNTKGIRMVTTRAHTPTKIKVLIIADSSCGILNVFLLLFDLTDFSI